MTSPATFDQNIQPDTGAQHWSPSSPLQTFPLPKRLCYQWKNLRECDKLWCKVAEWSRNQQLSQLWGLCLGKF